MTFEQAVKELAPTCPFTGKPIDPADLIETLKEDVIEAARRPGSWEGHNMLQVMISHGFLSCY